MMRPFILHGPLSSGLCQYTVAGMLSRCCFITTVPNVPTDLCTICQYSCQ